MSDEASSPSAWSEENIQLTSSALLSVAFAETCERLIYVRALLDDPRHETRRQGTAVARMLRAGLQSAERQLQAVRPRVFMGKHDDAPARQALAGIGVAVAGLRQVHAHLGYLGTRWPLGTTDLFTRKLVAEGAPVPVPTLCTTDRFDEAKGELGDAFHERLRDIGLAPHRAAGGTPILALPTTELLDPLSWAALLYGMAEAMVDGEHLHGQLRRPMPPSEDDEDGYRRACIASVAARLIGEPTFAACAMRGLIARLAGGAGLPHLRMLRLRGAEFAQALSADTATTLSDWLEGLLQAQAALGGGWGHVAAPPEPIDREDAWPEVAEFVRTLLPAPQLPTPAEIEALYEALCDGRPINAHPPTLPPDFRRQLEEGVDAARFYALLPQANERPCSLSTILTVGWRYKLRRSYALCDTLMRENTVWEEAIAVLAAHVLERCALLQQSIEAAYVQQVFSRWRDQ